MTNLIYLGPYYFPFEKNTIQHFFFLSLVINSPLYKNPMSAEALFFILTNLRRKEKVETRIYRGKHVSIYIEFVHASLQIK